MIRLAASTLLVSALNDCWLYAESLSHLWGPRNGQKIMQTYANMQKCNVEINFLICLKPLALGEDESADGESQKLRPAGMASSQQYRSQKWFPAPYLQMLPKSFGTVAPFRSEIRGHSAGQPF